MNVSSCFIQSLLCIYPPQRRHKESSSKKATIVLPVVIVAIYRNLEIKNDKKVFKAEPQRDIKTIWQHLGQ